MGYRRGEKTGIAARGVMRVGTVVSAGVGVKGETAGDDGVVYGVAAERECKEEGESKKLETKWGLEAPNEL